MMLLMLSAREGLDGKGHLKGKKEKKEKKRNDYGDDRILYIKLDTIYMLINCIYQYAVLLVSSQCHGIRICQCVYICEKTY